MTKTHYTAIAATIREENLAARGSGRKVVANLTGELCLVFKADNERFDVDTFLSAAGVKKSDMRESLVAKL